MKHTILWIVLSVAACGICSVVTYPIAHHRGCESGYRRGVNCGLRQGSFAQSIGFLAALQKLRAGDSQRATRFMETVCFTAAQTYFKDPTPSPGEASVWGRAQGLGRWPDTSAAKAVAQELLEYRATYRTNRADWDTMEQKLEVQLAKVK